MTECTHTPRPNDSNIVTLCLTDGSGAAWPLRLSADCMRFIGPYRRIDGFTIDALMLFEGVRKAG